MTTRKLKPNDRVKRVNQLGCYGTIKDIRAEMIPASAENKEKALIITVLWDNGTQSFFAPDALEVLDQG